MNARPSIEKILDHWRAVYPLNVHMNSDTYYEAIELMDIAPKEAEKMFNKIITSCGNGHLDAILHLGLLYNDIGKPIEGNALVTKAHVLAVEAFPKIFKQGKDQLHWSTLENRPVLRAFHAYGLELMKENYYEQAIKEFEFILKVNPGDNQGVRYLVIDCLLHLEQYAEFLKFEKRHTMQNPVKLTPFIRSKLTPPFSEQTDPLVFGVN